MSKIHSSVKYRLVKLPWSGRRCSFYTVYLIEEGITLFEKFLQAHEEQYPDALDNMLDRMLLQAQKFGAQEQHYRDEASTRGQEFVHALRDYPAQALRLYCIRYGERLVILGSGAPKNVRAWQDDKVLEGEVKFLGQVANDIETRRADGNLRFTTDGLDLEGNLTFDSNNLDEESN